MVFKKLLKLKAYSLQLKAYSLLLPIIFILVTCNTCHAEFYRYNIDDLARKAKARLQEIDNKIAEEKIAKELQAVLTELQSLSEKAEALFLERRYEEAAVLYRKIDRMSLRKR